MNTQPLYTQFILKIPGKYGVTQNVTRNFHALVQAKKRRRKKTWRGQEKLWKWKMYRANWDLNFPNQVAKHFHRQTQQKYLKVLESVSYQ